MTTACEIARQVNVNREKFERANRLHDNDNQPDRAIVLYDEIIADLDQVPDLAARELLAQALFFKSQAVFDLGQVDQALAIMAELTERFGQADELALRKTVIHALYLTVFVLRREHPGHEDSILAICDEAVCRFGPESDLWMRQRLLHFFIDKSFVLKELGRIEEGIALRHEVAARYERDPDRDLRELAQRVLDAMDLRFAV